MHSKKSVDYMPNNRHWFVSEITENCFFLWHVSAIFGFLKRYMYYFYEQNKYQWMSNLNVVLKIPYFCDRHLDRHEQRARTMSQVQVTKVESPAQYAKLGKQGDHPRVTFPSPYVPTKRHWKCSWFSKQSHKSVIYKQLRAARVQYLYNIEAKWMGTRFSIS